MYLSEHMRMNVSQNLENRIVLVAKIEYFNEQAGLKPRNRFSTPVTIVYDKRNILNYNDFCTN